MGWNGALSKKVSYLVLRARVADLGIPIGYRSVARNTHAIVSVESENNTATETASADVVPVTLRIYPLSARVRIDGVNRGDASQVRSGVFRPDESRSGRWLEGEVEQMGAVNESADSNTLETAGVTSEEEDEVNRIKR